MIHQHIPVRITLLAFLQTLLTSSHCLAGAESFDPPEPVLATNYVTVTNVIVVTVTNQVSGPLRASDTNNVAAEKALAAFKDEEWNPPEDGFDWIQLKSGEWLKGQIKAMQDRELEFDSEELDDQTFDWKDIRRLRSSRTLDVLFLDGRKLSGPVTVSPEQIAVHGDQTLITPRGTVLGLTPGGKRERDYWSGKVSFGLTLRSGNTEQIEYSAQARMARRTPATQLSLDYIGNLSSIGGVESANNHRVNTEFDVWFSQRFYLIVPFAEYYRDPFQNFEYRLTGGTGLGYDIIDRPKLEWTVTTGPAYQYRKYISSLPGEPTEKGALALVFGSRFDWDVTSRVELILEYRGQFTSLEAGETTHHGVATLSLDLTKRFDVDISLIWDRISNPKADENGLVPKPDDFRLIVGLGLDF